MIRSRHHVHCAAEGCSVRIGRGKLFCAGHYFSLPKLLRDALWNAWRAAMNARGRDLTVAQEGAIHRDYADAFSACVDHLRTAPMTSPAAMTATAITADGREVHFIEGRQL